MHSSFSLLATAPGRQRLVTFVLRVAHGTQLAPDPDELQLLAGFVRGEHTLDQLDQPLAARPAPVAGWSPARLPSSLWPNAHGRV